MRGTIATPMPICTKRLMLSMVGIAWNERDRTEIQTVVQHFMRDVPRKHAVDAHLDARMYFTKFGEGREESVDGTLVYAEGEFASLQTLQFGEPFFDFIAEVDQPFSVILQERSSVREADGPCAADEEGLTE